MEKMTESEKKLLNDLQAKLKRTQRAEAQFYKDADEKKDELLQRWKITDDALKSVASLYETDEQTLITWISAPEQIAYFHRHNNNYE